MGVVSCATWDIASVFLESASPGAEAEGVVSGKQAEGRSPLAPCSMLSTKPAVDIVVFHYFELEGRY